MPRGRGRVGGGRGLLRGGRDGRRIGRGIGLRGAGLWGDGLIGDVGLVGDYGCLDGPWGGLGWGLGGWDDCDPCLDGGGGRWWW